MYTLHCTLYTVHNIVNDLHYNYITYLDIHSFPHLLSVIGVHKISSSLLLLSAIWSHQSEKPFRQWRDSADIGSLSKCDKLIAVICVRQSEFLKGATVWLHQIFQRLRKIWVFERTNAQFTTVLPFLDHFKFFMLVFGIFFFCAKLLNRKIGRAKKFYFRKSGDSLTPCASALMVPRQKLWINANETWLHLSLYFIHRTSLYIKI